MFWLNRAIWKALFAITGILLLLMLMVCLPVSATGVQAMISGFPVPVTVQTTPTVDATMTELNKEKLNQEIEQLQQSNNRGLGDWLWSNAAAVLSSFLSTLVVVIGILIGFRQWRVSRTDTQDKELKDRQNERDKRAEERFQAAVTDWEVREYAWHL